MTPAALVDFWRAAEPDWFSHDPAFDARFWGRFLDLHMAVAARRHDAWAAAPEVALALVLLTDQFPRNAFRGTGHSAGVRHRRPRSRPRGGAGRAVA